MQVCLMFLTMLLETLNPLVILFVTFSHLSLDFNCFMVMHLVVFVVVLGDSVCLCLVLQETFRRGVMEGC